MIDAHATIYNIFQNCMSSVCTAIVKMKILRATLQTANIMQDSKFNTVETLEMFLKMPFIAIPDHQKTEPRIEVNNEALDDKKRKQRKKRILTGVSRQRRAANDRERRRNVKLNQAFVTLKKALPLANIDISKIEILRLAVKWIDHLATLLKENEQQKNLLQWKDPETPADENGTYNHMAAEQMKPVRHDCLYHQDPDLRNTLWEDCIGLPKRSCDDNEGCIHIRSNSRFHELFS